MNLFSAAGLRQPAASPPRLAATSQPPGGRTFLSALLVLLVFSMANAQPDTLWMKFYPDWEGNDQCKRLIRTADGGFMIGGKTGFPDYDYLLVKIDTEFNTEWSRIYGDLQYQDFFGGVAQMPDGGYILSGTISRNASTSGALLRLDGNGDTLWEQSYGPTYFYDLTLSYDGNPVAAGNRYENGSDDAWLLKADTDGNIIWSEGFGGENHSTFFRVISTQDCGFLAVGLTASRGLIAKVDSTGREEWLRSVSFNGGLVKLRCAAQTVDGGYIAGGYSDTLIGQWTDHRFYLVRLTSDGETVWSRRWGSRQVGTNAINEIILAPGGGYLAVGQSADWGYAVVRLDGEGEVLWELPFDGEDRGDWFDAGLLMEDGGYLLGGWKYVQGPEMEAWLVRTTPDLTYNSVRLLDPAFPSQFNVGAPYPNPFNSSTRISFSVGAYCNTPLRLAIYDLSGREVADFPHLLAGGELKVGSRSVTWNASSQPAGLYFVRLQAGSMISGQKLVIVK